MNRSIVALALLAAVNVAWTTAGAMEKVDPAAYSELAPALLLPPIIAELRHTLPDVYSLREMKLCPASAINLKEGKPASWAVRLEFNAKNEAGGYTGVRRYVALFRNGRVLSPINTTDFVGRDGFNSIFNRIIDKQMERCQPVKSADLEKALAAEAP